MRRGRGAAPQGTERRAWIGRVSALGLLLAACLLMQPAGPVQAGGNIEDVIGGTIGNKFWDKRTFPIKWFFNRNDAAGFPPFPTITQVLQPAFDAWTNLPNNDLAFSNGLQSSTRDAALDGRNVLIFNPKPAALGGFVASSPCNTLTADQVVPDFRPTDPAGDNPADGLGWIRLSNKNILKVPVGTYLTGTNVDCDIIFDVVNNTLTTDNTPGTEDVRGVAVHEIGHWHSLSHSPLPEATMYPFTDSNPAGDGIFPGGGTGSLDSDDASSTGHIYKDASYDTVNGTITGKITLNGQPGDGVHVTALRTSDLKPVAGRFSISRFFRAADALDGADFAAQGGGFYRLDGLPPDDYYICLDFFDGTDERIGGRLGAIGGGAGYNTTVPNSNVADGGFGGDFAGGLGFKPERRECYNTLESADGGDGTTPGAAADNPDEAAVVSLAAGQTVPGINIQINLDPATGKTPSARQNPTGIARSDLGTTTLLAAVTLETGGANDDYWLVKFPAISLPTVPYNVTEGIWSKFGRSNDVFIGGLAMADAGVTTVQPPIVFGSRRMMTGWDGNKLATGELFEVRDRFNVTINQSRDLFFIVKQPATTPGSTTNTQGAFALAHDAGAGAASLNSLFTTDNFASFLVSTRFDVVYRVRTETAPPVMITGAAPATVTQADTGKIITISGAGFRAGAQVAFLTPSFGNAVASGVTVTGVTFVSASQLDVTVDVGPAAPLGPLDVQVTNPEVIIPNRARLMSTLAAPDTDGDGFIDAIDCAPANPSLWAVPGAVGSTAVTVTEPIPGTARVAWTPSSTPGSSNDRFRVVSGPAAALRSMTGPDFGTCLVDQLLLMSTDDPGALTVGQITIYMVSQTNSCGTGTYGSSARDGNAGNCAP